ncbi:hypothetical protein E3C22_20320 [Jiella endophytica]|uniref:Uncharacterized protein n=1 Tax=Jiella endophytica TaxID=2558362 RepID=A0A4Y8RCZ8_9HYPH|nr:hypothetical protein [Jiella endophytica]TFF19120.1 hypothetical protein E3C22_20320 [Jiella endophytica]
MKTIRSPLTAEEIRRFLDATIGSDQPCPRCDTRQWIYPQEDENGQMLGLSITDASGNISGVYTTIVLHCANCGFVSPHAKSVVVNWLNENPSG